jgi:hypothetical protein
LARPDLVLGLLRFIVICFCNRVASLSHPHNEEIWSQKAQFDHPLMRL